MKPIVVFRTDGSHKIGTGHVLRSLKVADVLKKKFNAEVVFVTRNDKFSIELIRSKKYKYFVLAASINKTAEAEFIYNKIKLIPAVFVFDFYGAPGSITKDYIRSFRNKFDSSRFIAMDNLSDAVVEFDAVIYPNAHISKKELPKTSKNIYHSGPEYLILPEGIQRVRHKLRSKVKSILISLGGSDPYHITERVIQYLHRLIDESSTSFYGVELSVVIGPLFKGKDELISECKKLPIKTKIFVSPSTLLSIYKNTDVAIVGFGMTMYECFALGIPTAVISHTEFTNRLFPTFEKLGASINLGFQGDLNYRKIQKKFFPIIRDNKKLIKMAHSAKKYKFKHGVENIAKIILGI